MLKKKYIPKIKVIRPKCIQLTEEEMKAVTKEFISRWFREHPVIGVSR